MSALLRPSGMDNVSPASDPDMVRIGTTERGVGRARARRAFRGGRLNTGDYEQHVTAAYEAATLAGLRPLFEDLPEPRPAFLSPPVTMPPVSSYPSTRRRRNPRRCSPTSRS
jgi:hypothetical protein